MKKENFSKYLPFLIVAVFGICLFVFVEDIKNIENIKFVRIAGQDIQVKLALTPSEQAEGLSGQDKLEHNTGMLFVFKQIGEHNFWMQDMNFPIDIIWLSHTKQVIYIKIDAQPTDFPEVYGPKENSKYVLEVLAGFSQQNNLQVGDRVEFIF